MAPHPALAAHLPAAFAGASVLVAAINETRSLRETVETLAETCRPGDIVETLLILHPEKTTPECRAVADSLVANPPAAFPVRIVLQRLPFVGGAYRSAFPEARGSHSVMMSADLETPPAAVARMLEEARRMPGGVVTASRWMDGGGFAGYGLVKRLCNVLFQRFLSILFATRLNDLTFGFRVYPTAFLNAVKWRETRHPFFLESSLVPLRLGLPFVQVPALWRSRREGVSQNGFFANFRYFRTAFRLRFARAGSLLR